MEHRQHSQKHATACNSFLRTSSFITYSVLSVLPFVFSPPILMLLTISHLFLSLLACMHAHSFVHSLTYPLTHPLPHSLTHSLWASTPAVCLCFPNLHGTSPSVCYCRLCWTWAGLYNGLKAFASNENLVLDYRASAQLAPLFQQPERHREREREREGRVYFSPETVGRMNSVVKPRLHLSWTNDVT